MFALVALAVCFCFCLCVCQLVCTLWVHIAMRSICLLYFCVLVCNIFFRVWLCTLSVLFLQINMVDRSPGILRVPRDRRNLDKLLREASRKRLLHTCWGKELRLFNQVDPEYFASMGSEEQRIWTVSYRSRAHTKTHPYSHTTGHEVRCDV